MLNLGFRNFSLTFSKSTFFSCNTFSVLMYDYLFELILAFLTFGDKGVRVLGKTFPKAKPFAVSQNFQGVQKPIFLNGKHGYHNSLTNSGNLRKRMNYGKPCVNFPSYFQL